MENKDISKIIVKKLTNSISSNEETELKQWLSASEDNQEGYQKIKEVWDLPVENENQESLDLLYNKLKFRAGRLQKNDMPRLGMLRWKIAVSILVLLSIGLLSALILKGRTKPLLSMTLQTEKGQRSFAELPDGTKVWLNADTKLIVGDFSKTQRAVSLSGEAQFEVVHDSNRPFIVSFNQLDVEVLGTTFNIRAYPDENIMKASLLEGSIHICERGLNGKGGVYLKPGQAAVFDKTKNAFVVKKEKNIEENTHWRKGVLVFHSIPFPLLMQEIERSYNVKINYPQSDFKNIHYSGTIDNLKITQVFEFLSYTIPMQYSMDKNVININLNVK